MKKIIALVMAFLIGGAYINCQLINVFGKDVESKSNYMDSISMERDYGETEYAGIKNFPADELTFDENNEVFDCGDTININILYPSTIISLRKCSLLDSYSVEKYDEYIWEKCCSTKQFNYFANSEKKIQLYNDFTNILKNMYFGNNSCEIITVDDNNSYITYGKIRYTDYCSGTEEALDVIEASLFDHPLCFFNSGTILVYDEYLYFLTDETCDEKSEIDFIRGKIEDIIKKISRYTENVSTDIDRALVIHDYILDNFDYAYMTDGLTPRDDLKYRNVSGLISDDQRFVCEGFAKTYMSVMLYVGIDTMISTGWAVEDGTETEYAEKHAWNICFLDNKYYAVDLTWDDSEDKTNIFERYRYFANGQSVYNTHSITKKNNTSYTFVSHVPQLEETDYKLEKESYSDGSIEFSIYGNIATLVKCDDKLEEVVIPELINGKKVVSIQGDAFACNNNIKQVIIPNTVIEIEDGKGAFYECTNLNSVIIPDDSQLRYIGEWAFYGCTALSSIKLPKTIKKLGLSCFQGCINIEKMILPDGIEVVCQNALTSTGITNLNIPATVTEFSVANDLPRLEHIDVDEENPIYLSYNGALYYYGPWISTSIDFDGNMNIVESGIGWGLVIYPEQKKDATYTVYSKCDIIFSNEGVRRNNYLKTINLLNVQIVHGSYLSCGYTVSPTNEKYCVKDNMLFSKDGTILYRIMATLSGKIVIPEGTKVIDTGAGYNGTYQSIVIPDSVKIIGNAVFESCHNLEEIVIPDGVTNIGNAAFSDCTSLESIKIPKSVTSIKWNTFMDCRSLKNVEFSDGILNIELQAFAGCSALEQINIPEGVVSIGHYAFNRCYNLKRITIPKTVTDIDDIFYLWNDELIIMGETGSSAEAYAKKKDIKFMESNHDWDNGVITTNATCTEPGIKTYTCSTCGKKYYEKVLSKGHLLSIVLQLDPTCTMPGHTEYSYCMICNNVIQEMKEIPALGHTWNDGDVTTAPTCTEAGVKTFTCETCGETRTEEIKATAHTVVDDEAVAPTCTKTGLAAGSHCSVCNEVLQAQEEIPALGHTWNDGEIITSPTCTETGVKTFTCETCGETRTEEVKATGHTVVDDDAVAPTCTKTGLTAGSHCSVCNEVLKAQEEIAALGHTWNNGEVTTAPTCTEAGVKTFTCEICGDTRTEGIKATGHTAVDDEAVAPTCTKPGLTAGSHCSVCNEVLQAQEEIPALGHTWNAGEVTTAPTCTKTGVKTFTCETCGETRTEEVKATGHTVVDDDAVAPTCTKTGLTAGSHCSVCNEVLKAQEEIAALGHTWNNGEVTTAPTCTEAGVKTFTCETCGEIRTEEVKATGHTVVDDYAVEPTCTKTGLTAGSHCSVCNEVLQAQKEIPALGHTWNAGEVTTAPTYTAVGVKTYTCEICGETRTESIPKLSRIDISKATSKVKVSGISAKIYNGKSQTQSALVVTANGKKLKKDTDYSVAYSNNKNIGTATITITGKNGYTGTVRKTFAIKPQVGKVYTTSLKYKVTNARVDGKGTVSVVGSAYKSGDRKFTTLKITDTVTIGGVKFKITKIEKNAFRGYKYLSTVTIGSNVTSVGDTAFYGCGKLTTVTVGKRVKTIGAKSFAGCKSLKRVKLLTTQLAKIGTSAFNGIKSNATFALPKKYYNSYSKMIKKAGASKKAVYKKF